MGSKRQPSPPDPVATANAQAAANAEAVRESARVNQINVSGPWGSTTYRGEIGSPDRTQITELSPAAQQVYDNQADIGQALTGYGRTLAQQIQGLPQFRINGSAPPSGTMQQGAAGPPTGMPLPGNRPPAGSPAPGGAQASSIPAAGTSSRVSFNAPDFGSSPIGFNIDDINSILSLQGAGQDRSGQANYVSADFSGVPSAPWEGDRSADIDAVERATYDRAYNRLRPDIDRQRSELEARLATQGIGLDSDVYRREMDRFDRGVQQQLTDLSLGAVTAGRAEDSRLFDQGLRGQGQAFDQAVARYGIRAGEDERLFGQELATGQFDQAERQRLAQTRAAKAAFDQAEAERLFARSMAEAGFAQAEDQRLFGNDNATRDRAIQEMITERQMPMNELAAILQGAPALQAPPVPSPGQYQVQPADIMGATYANYQQQAANANAQRQGLYGLLGAGANAAAWAWSDRRLKSRIRRIATLPNGLGVYAYTKFGRPEIGLMADEVRRIRPWAVARIAGYDAVNYREALR